jgi:hypothetical protein
MINNHIFIMPPVIFSKMRAGVYPYHNGVVNNVSGKPHTVYG